MNEKLTQTTDKQRFARSYPNFYGRLKQLRKTLEDGRRLVLGNWQVVMFDHGDAVIMPYEPEALQQLFYGQEMQRIIDERREIIASDLTMAEQTA